MKTLHPTLCPTMDDFLFALRTVAPLLLVMAAGAIARALGLFPTALRKGMNKLIFYLLLPVLLLNNVLSTDLSAGLPVNLLMFVGAAVTASFLLCWIAFYRFPRSERAALTQIAVRSNCAFFGIPLAAAIHPGGDMSLITLAVAFTVPMYNIYSVFILTKGGGKGSGMRATAHAIVTNPLIIACVLGLVLLFCGFKPPKIVNDALSQIARAASPMALIVLGASLDLKGLRGSLKPTLAGVGARLLVCPLLAVGSAYLLDFRGTALAAILCIFAGPSAVSAYSTADQMGVESDLTARLVLATTLLSGVSITLFLWALRALDAL